MKNASNTANSQRKAKSQASNNNNKPNNQNLFCAVVVVIGGVSEVGPGEERSEMMNIDDAANALTAMSDTKLAVASNSSTRKVHVKVRLQTDEDSDHSSSSKQERMTGGIIVAISHPYYTSSDHEGSECRGRPLRSYQRCSLLLQLGKFFGISPSHAPSPRISSIFDMLIEKWCLKRETKSNNEQYAWVDIEQLSEIYDGDKLILSCGGYAKKDSSDGGGSRRSSGTDLLSLVPSKYNNVKVQLVSASSANMQGTDDDNDTGFVEEVDNASDSEVEDVTPKKKKRSSSPEIIDISSGDDDNEDKSDTCFWEFDKQGHMRRNADHEMMQKNSKSNNNADARLGGSAKWSGEDQSDTSSDVDQECSDEEVISISSDSDDSSSDVEDVTDMCMAKLKEEKQQQMEKAEEIDDSDSGDKKVASGKKKKKAARPSKQQPTAKRRKKKPLESPIQVLLDDKDLPICPGAKSVEDNAENNQVDHSIKQRIVKLLNTGFHDESNEHEARNAMKLARRLCERYNLDQAVLLQERGDGSLNSFSTSNESEGSLQGGIVTAKIRNRKTNKPPSALPRWHDYLVNPICLNFHVEAFKTVARSTALKLGECSVTFYGIRTNAQLAAYAFKVASERISLMSASYNPPRTSIQSRAKQTAETKNARLSYALGIVNGLKKDVEKGLQEEEDRRNAKLRQAQKASKSGEAYHEDSASEGEVDDKSYDDHNNTGSMKLAEDEVVNHPGITNSNATCHLEKLERENSAQLALVDHQKKIASDVLKVCVYQNGFIILIDQA